MGVTAYLVGQVEYTGLLNAIDALIVDTYYVITSSPIRYWLPDQSYAK